jgi:hypothetical protein
MWGLGVTRLVVGSTSLRRASSRFRCGLDHEVAYLR